MFSAFMLTSRSVILALTTSSVMVTGSNTQYLVAQAILAASGCLDRNRP